MTTPITHDDTAAPEDPDPDPAKMFVPNDTFLSNRDCPRLNPGAAAGSGVVLPCGVCPEGRCWFIEMTAVRRAGMPALTPRAWRRHVKETTPDPEEEDDDGAAGDD